MRYCPFSPLSLMSRLSGDRFQLDRILHGIRLKFANSRTIIEPSAHIRGA